MDLVEPRSKKCRLQPNLPLPIILKKDNTILKIKGIYNEFSVIIENQEDMKNIISMGYFGKSNLSRSYPQFAQYGKDEIIRQRQYDRRKVWAESLPTTESKKIIVVPDSDEEQENYFTNLKPVYQIDHSGTKETVWLCPEEAFFLSETVKCLDISYDNEILSSDKCWTIFSEGNDYFQFNYVVLYYFRAKNWVVKPGIKFGGDYCTYTAPKSVYNNNVSSFLVLYQQGPPFYHASYVVIIDILNHHLERVEKLSRRLLDNLSLHGLNRLCETAGKELLILQIILPENIDDNFKFSYKDIAQFQVKEVLFRRWISNQENN